MWKKSKRGIKKMEDIKRLDTEQNNPKTWNIDQCDTKEMLTLINEEDQSIADAVAKCIDEIAKLVDHVVMGIRHGGRLFYIGAGTSGRLGILDASECPPTFGVSDQLVQGLMAGGLSAMEKAKEGAEDLASAGKADLQQHSLNKHDVVVGIAASGRTPYVIHALYYAKEIGCYCGAISCVRQAKISAIADAKIEAITGAEVISGSTRMKAGTAQKMILNMISTATMIRLGKTYHNYMVDVNPTNEKLRLRSLHIIQACCDCTIEAAASSYEEAEHHVKLAVLMNKSNKSKSKCLEALKASEGHLHLALSRLQ